VWDSFVSVNIVVQREIVQPNGNKSCAEFKTLHKEERRHLLKVIPKKKLKD
jgi:hypothetical protein